MTLNTSGFLWGATEKVKIDGKYTSEAKNGDLVDDNNIYKVYEDEIIAKSSADLEIK